MTWFKVDRSFHSHPKVRAAGLAPLGLWVRAGSWCVSYKTNGFIPNDLVKIIDPSGHHAETLVSVGLWKAAVEDDKTGYRFHQWASHQRPDYRRTDDADNLQTLCIPCNCRKGARV